MLRVPSCARFKHSFGWLRLLLCLNNINIIMINDSIVIVLSVHVVIGLATPATIACIILHGVCACCGVYPTHYYGRTARVRGVWCEL